MSQPALFSDEDVSSFPPRIVFLRRTYDVLKEAFDAADAHEDESGEAVDPALVREYHRAERQLRAEEARLAMPSEKAESGEWLLADFARQLERENAILRTTLIRAAEMIESEYCSHMDIGSADNDRCAAQFIHKALSLNRPRLGDGERKTSANTTDQL